MTLAVDRAVKPQHTHTLLQIIIILDYNYDHYLYNHYHYHNFYYCIDNNDDDDGVVDDDMMNAVKIMEIVITTTEPCHEIMALFFLRKRILQTRMRSHPLGLDVWFFAGPFVFFHTSCVNSEGSGETALMRRLTWAFAGHLCDKYYNFMSWLYYTWQNFQLHRFWIAVTTTTIIHVANFQRHRFWIAVTW